MYRNTHVWRGGEGGGGSLESGRALHGHRCVTGFLRRGFYEEMRWQGRSEQHHHHHHHHCCIEESGFDDDADRVTRDRSIDRLGEVGIVTEIWDVVYIYSLGFGSYALMAMGII